MPALTLIEMTSQRLDKATLLAVNKYTVSDLILDAVAAHGQSPGAATHIHVRGAWWVAKRDAC
jgi:hypothetical protein